MGSRRAARTVKSESRVHPVLSGPDNKEDWEMDMFFPRDEDSRAFPQQQGGGAQKKVINASVWVGFSKQIFRASGLGNEKEQYNNVEAGGGGWTNVMEVKSPAWVRRHGLGAAQRLGDKAWAFKKKERHVHTRGYWFHVRSPVRFARIIFGG